MVTAAETAAAWDVEVQLARRPPSGTNNLVWFINDMFVLRVYQNLDGERVQAEHRLLDALRDGALPFDVPEPLRTRAGDTWIDTPAGPAALYRLIGGRRARQEVGDLELIGAALGDLMVAFRALPTSLAPIDWRVPLSGVHPAVPDIGDLVDELGRLAPGADGLATFASRWMASDDADRMLELPAQVCHLDFAPSNVLIEDGRVTAVLDFEIAGLDVRINDVVAALVQSTDTRTEREALVRGLTSRIDISDEEWTALPLLMLRRRIATVVWRAGRWREGKSSLDDVLERLAAVDVQDEA